MTKRTVLEFWQFCSAVLGLKLTTGQRVLAKVAFGPYQPKDLEGEEQKLAVELFGGVAEVSLSAKRFVIMRLGRGSGKTTLCAAFAIYCCITFDIRLAGPGSIPQVVIIAPDKETAKLSVSMAREMIRQQPALERLMVNDTAQMIQLRRTDGRMVKVEAFAASKHGNNIRGRDIMAFIFDEAEFLTSNGDGERDFAVNDEDIFRALKPRLMPGGKGMLISTPWPIETLMGRMFEHNWTKPDTGVAIKAPTTSVRDEPHIIELVNEEVRNDPENARREFFCELEGVVGGEFFDSNALSLAIEPTLIYPGRRTPDYPVAVGCDLGFTRDSSALAVVEFTGKFFNTLFLEEIRPKPGVPLKPSEVIKLFAEKAKQYSVAGVIADVYYRESLKEQLQEHNLSVWAAPEGSSGKAQVFQRTRAVLHEGLVKLPDNQMGRRLVAQAKLVTSKPAPGGTTTIRVPRKIGMGHGDLVSAWTLAVHELAYRNVANHVIQYEQGSPEWIAEFNRRVQVASAKAQDDYLKRIVKEEKSKMSKARYKKNYAY